jgi:hypothetical protein
LSIAGIRAVEIFARILALKCEKDRWQPGGNLYWINQDSQVKGAIMDINDLHEPMEDDFFTQGFSHDLDADIDSLVRDVDERIARERMRWPNPNPDDELQEIWHHYEAAWVRAVFGSGESTESGLSPTDELAYWWQRYQQAVIDEGSKLQGDIE